MTLTLCKLRNGCGFPPISHRLQCGCILVPRISGCGFPPISHRLQCTTRRRPGAGSCGFPPISHRLQSANRAYSQSPVAVSPRSPIGYNRPVDGRVCSSLRFPPDLPSATMRAALPVGRDGCGFPPISHRLQSSSCTYRIPRCCGFPPISHRLQLDLRRSSARQVAVSPRSPIGYNVQWVQASHLSVAVSPRSPIGYNRGSVGPAWNQVRPGVRRPAEKRPWRPQNRAYCSGFLLAGRRLGPSKLTMFSYCLSVKQMI